MGAAALRQLVVSRNTESTQLGMLTRPLTRMNQGQQQDWFLKCLQGGRTHALAACGMATLSAAGT